MLGLVSYIVQNLLTNICNYDRKKKSIVFFLLQVHILEVSRVADHCRTLALSDGTSGELTQNCDHQHGRLCESCEQVNELVSGMIGWLC